MMDPSTTGERAEQIRTENPYAGVVQKVTVTARSSTGDAPVSVSTPASMPDILIVPLTVTKRLTVRVLRTYFQSLVGFLLTAGFTGTVAPGAAPVPLTTFQGVMLTAAAAALVPAVMSLLTNLVILFTKLDESSPDVMG